MKYYTDALYELIGYDFYCDIADNIARERKRKKWTQKDLAENAKITQSRLQSIEAVKTRILLCELEAIAKSLGVSVDLLIDAEFGCQGKECLYLVWNKDYPEFKLYRKATSSRMAALLHYEFIRNRYAVDARTRYCAKLVGVPFSEEELRRMYPERDKKQPYDALEPDEG